MGPSAPFAPMGTPAPELTEEQIQEALKRLKLMHIKLRELRGTIPVMVKPFASAQTYPSPEHLFAAASKSMTEGHKQVQEFKQLMTSDESKKAMEQATRSREKNPYGIKPWEPKDDANWFTLDK